MSEDWEDEEQRQRLLVPTADNLASVKVFPLILNIKRDVVVSAEHESCNTPGTKITSWLDQCW